MQLLKKDDCVLQNRCREDQLVYKAEIYTTDNKMNKKIYVGISGTKFKDRLGNHRFSFKHEEAKNSTTLSKEVWRIREEQKTEPGQF